MRELLYSMIFQWGVVVLIEPFNDLTLFNARMADFFTKDPVHHAPILKILTTLEKNFNQFGEEAPWFFCVSDEGEIFLAPACTPPRPLVMTDMPNSAVCRLVEYLKNNNIELGGLRGPLKPSQLFVKLWHELKTDDVRPVVELRLYQLDEVDHTIRTPGRLVQAGPEHQALVHAWVTAFSIEVALPHGGPTQASIASRIAMGEYYFWEVGETMTCIAGKNARPHHGVSHVGPVYTPPEHRGHGYATDVSAALSQLILDEGAKYSSLFADLHNPQTNKIYQMIGYEEIGIHNVYSFAP